jgi:hypothetical protein
MAMTSAQTPQARITATGSFPIRHVPIPTPPPPPTEFSGFILGPKTTASMSETGGLIRSLTGFHPPKHTVPKSHTSAASSFVNKLLADDVASEGREALGDVQKATGLRLADIEVIEDVAVYHLRAERFTFEIVGHQDGDDAARWQTDTRLELKDGWQAVAEELDEALGTIFDIVEVAIDPPAALLSELAAQMEDLKVALGGTVTMEDEVAAFAGDALTFEINRHRMVARLRFRRKYSLRGALEEARRWHLALSV